MLDLIAKMENQQLHQDSLPSRLVHLDCKGAPLNMAYLDRILPLVKRWGCTGILMEYEDTFPYEDDLKVLAAPHGYSKEDIEKLFKTCNSLGLEVIPLIQTFGHVEFVLKHERFSSLREVWKYPMALCPSNPDSFQLVRNMLDQVIKLHPSATRVHVGCDEVFHLGLCDKCKAVMERESVDKEQLFFAHVKKLASYIRGKYLQVLTCIVWDDMFRNAEQSAILESGLGDLIEPMVWHYQPTFQLPANLWDKLGAVFPNIWIASAFKGATGPNAMLTNIHFHVDNHCTWLTTLQGFKHKFKTVRGIALTGWQRYDHFAVLCELFPQGLPSLAMCLKFLQLGKLTAEDVALLAKDLSFTSDIPLDPVSCTTFPACKFPGSDVYHLTIELFHHHRACSEFFNSDGISGWMNEYNVSRCFINPVHVEPLYARARSLLDSFRSMEQRAGPAFSGVFLPGVVDEWRGCFLAPFISRLEQAVATARTFVEGGSNTGQSE